MRRRMRACSLAATITALLLTGCGGGSSPSGSSGLGQAQFTVQWPTQQSALRQPRLVPAAANSIVITLTDSQQKTIAAQTLVKPQGLTGYPGGPIPATATFTGLTPGQDKAAVVAYPNLDGTGTPLAQARVPLTITAGQTTTTSATLASTIRSVLVAPGPPALPVGQSLALSAVVFDGPQGTGDVVLSFGFTWSSSNPALATVDPNTGLVTAVSDSGTVTITATAVDTMPPNPGPPVSGSTTIPLSL